MFQLSQLTPLVKKRKRIGRGGSRGGTSGRGHKGQKARSGHRKVPSEFEGGQMPLTRRLPKRGFTNIFAKEFTILNLSTLENDFSMAEVVNRESLIKKGIIKKSNTASIKILGNGQLTKKLSLQVDAVSASARKAVEEHGGEVHLLKEK